MQVLIERQCLIGKNIEKIISNFSKDSSKRKTLPYLQTRLEQLETEWCEFDQNDSKLHGMDEEVPQHAYFSTKYYERVKAGYENLKANIKQKMQELHEQGPSKKMGPDGKSLESTPGFSKNVEESKPEGSGFTFDPCEVEEPTHSKELQQLVQRQKAIMAALTHKLKDIESQNIQGKSRPYYELKIKSINDYWSDITTNNQSIWALSPVLEPFGYQAEYYYNMEQWVDDTIIKLSQELDALSPGLSSTNYNNCALRLPKITLPVFDGDYLKWQQFHELYTQLIHNQPISNAQKMFYLTTNLTGEARTLIQHLPITEANYISAWEILEGRYNNKRLLITALLNKMLSQPKIQDDSAASVRAFHDTINEGILGLKNMGILTDSWDPILLHLLIRKLDKTTHNLYEQSLDCPREIQSVSAFLNFLELRFQSLEALSNKDIHRSNRRNQKGNSQGSAVLTASSNSSCLACKQNHALFSCPRFLQLSLTDRFNLLKKHKACINCLREGHTVTQCSSRSCTRCQKKHNTLLHGLSTKNSANSKNNGKQQASPTQQTQSTQGEANENPSGPQSTALSAATTNTANSYVLLATALVELIDKNGNPVECRAILDSGSQLNFISKRMSKKLHLNRTRSEVNIAGIGTSRHQAQQRMTISLQSRNTGFATTIEAFILTKIAADQPQSYINTSSWDIPSNIKLADPKFNEPGRIDLLIGAELYASLMSIGQIKLDDARPILQNTVFGWIMMGKLANVPTSNLFCGIGYENHDVDTQLRRFWEIEEPTQNTRPMTASERKCEELFSTTTKRDKDGRFIVKLPFAQAPSTLGKSRDLATRRFFCLERKLMKDPELKKQYSEFIHEYSQLKHMEEIHPSKISNDSYFLPHHCVLKPSSSTTKLRVVFDASAKTSNNLSLNDILLTGPSIQDELFNILIRFRFPRYVFTADIAKMYRQILVSEEDRQCQLIVWRDNPHDELKFFRLNTVTYGTSPASYLATRCLHELAVINNNFSRASTVIKRDFYMDDLMSGGDDLKEVKDLQKQIATILSSGGFKLRKWCANNPELLKGIPSEDIETHLEINNGVEGQVKTLGLTWRPNSDMFTVKTSWVEVKRVTKRTILSDIAHVFDPLGFVNPVIVSAKILLQQLWLLKLDWDSALPMELQTKWLKFRQELPKLNSLTIPRYVGSSTLSNYMQIHAFSDASEKAYGTAIYIRSIDPEGKIVVRLLCAKSRVAPTKTISLPRLELCAAVLAAQLTNKLQTLINIKGDQTFFWTDSQIVLSWLQAESSSFKTFVANRTAIIQDLTNVNRWRHVGTKLNPADLVSRGVSPRQLIESKIWFCGPEFLQMPEVDWPRSDLRPQPLDVERRKTHIVLSATQEEDGLLYRINHKNSFQHLQRVTARILCFIKKLKNRVNKQYEKELPTTRKAATWISNPSAPLTVKELDIAMSLIITAMQTASFREDIKRLKGNKEIGGKSKLATLAPFLDEKGILRVGGRLQASSLSYDTKHPIVLPYDHAFTKLLMHDLHTKNIHAGPQALLAITRQRYWPIKGKILATSIVQNCMRCAKTKPQLFSQIMGNLPAPRIEPGRAFLNVGVDFGGPIWVHYKTRGKKPQKAYIAVFCCFATKAIHLELVSDLTTDGFIGALRRFTGRRGNCRNIYCDNATNFVGARNQLDDLKKSLHSEPDKIIKSCNSKGIDFHFIPPRAPHFGGLWEAAIKSAKNLLYKNIKAASLTYEELETLLIDIEAILNSRPITPMSTNPNDLAALTPGHFIIGEPLTAVVDPASETSNKGLLARWKLVSHLKHEFWRRWSLEYLTGLQQRYKWKKQSQNALPGMMVLIKDSNLPPMKWQLGRIIETFKGEDNLVRVADVKTSSGIFRRAIHHLCPLPVDSSNPEPEPIPSVTPKSLNTSGKPHKTAHTVLGPVIKHRNKGKFKPISQGAPRISETSKRPMEEVSENNNQYKRPYIPTGALSLLLLAILILPILGSDVEITPFKSQPGIYFENLGITNLISNEWKIIVYYDMRPYWQEFEGIQNGITRLQYLCNTTQGEGYCTTILSQLHHHIDEIEHNNEFINRTNYVLGRTKRAPLEIVGNIANMLFGVLDQGYAEKVSQIIDEIRSNEGHLLQLMKNQTSVIEATTNIMKRDQMAINSQFEEFDKHLSTLSNEISDIKQEIYLDRLKQLFTSLTIQMTLVITNYIRTQGALLDVIMDTKHGKISPLLLRPDQLRKELSGIKDHLPITLKLPGTPNHFDLVQLFNLMSVQGQLARNHIVFNIHLPLFINEDFEMFRVIPVPVLINDTFIAVKTPTKFLVVNLHRDQYYLISDTEATACAHNQGNEHICKQQHPIYSKNADLIQCEANFLNNLPLSPACEISKTTNTQDWIQLFKPNQWIFVMTKEVTITIVCQTTVAQRTIKGSGILKLGDNCIIKHETMTINSHNVYPSHLRTSFLPSLNISDHINISHPTHLSYQPRPHKLNLSDLEEIQERIQQLKEYQITEPSLPAHDVHQFFIGYFGLFLVITIGSCLWWRTRRPSPKSTRHEPTPAPRNLTSKDFTFGEVSTH